MGSDWLEETQTEKLEKKSVKAQTRRCEDDRKLRTHFEVRSVKGSHTHVEAVKTEQTSQPVWKLEKTWKIK